MSIKYVYRQIVVRKAVIMDKAKDFHRQIIGILSLIFLLYNIAIVIAIKVLSFFDILNVSLNFDSKSLITYAVIIILYNIIAVFLVDYIFKIKFDTHNGNLYFSNFSKKNRQQDILTGLYNRNALETKVSEMIANAPEKVGGMLFIDIDNIKFINDKYGHDVGDKFILKLSELLCYFEKYNGIVSRISGDEFVVYLHGFEKEEMLLDVFKGIYSFSESFKVVTPDGIENKVRFSSGLAWYPRNAVEFKELYKLSDFALYNAKNNEKGKLFEFNEETYKENYFILENSLAINQLLDNKLVKFAYQPIVDLKTGEIFAFEALLRSKMDNFKSPLEIIDVAKTQCKLPQLENLAIFSVYEDIEKNESLIGDRKIFLNSLPSQVLDIESLDTLVERYNKYFGQVVFEITEQENKNKENMKRKLEFLRKHNLGIAVDDFGSGFSNEIRILALKPNIVKVAMELIQGISTDPDKQAIVANLVDFCHNKKIKVVAEGVEQSEDLKYIIDMGIDYVQGYYLARPAFEFNDIPRNVKEEILKYNNVI